MTWEEARDVQEKPWIGLLPIGAVEAHGPHLPVRTDGIIAEAWAREAAERLDARGMHPLILPTIDYTTASFAESFPGTLSVARETVTRLVLDVARASEAHGARALVLCNAHLDPAHLAALRDAVQRAYSANLPIVFPDLTRRVLAAHLTDEFQSGACHAGQYETSIVMAVAPELVREDVRKELPPNPASLSDAIRDGHSTFQESGGPQAYFGFPADASAEEGASTLRILGGLVEESVLAVLSPEEAEESS
jgi:creatinine amidohydrolase